MIYLILVDRFVNGDPANDGAIDLADPAAFHGGDLRGVMEKLPYLDDLGVDTIWLTPITRMRTTPFYGHGAFHGYWVEDLFKVEPRFGGEDTVRALSDEVHRRGMRLVLDMVYNHVAPEGQLTKTHPDWFHGRGSIQNWSDPVEVVEGQVHGLPDLAQENEAVYEHLLAATLKWLALARPDGLRVDAVRHLPTSFLARLDADLEGRVPEGFQLLGEVFDGDPLVVAKTQREAKLDAVFDFPLHYAMVDVFCHGRHPGALGAVLSLDDAYDDPGGLVTFLDNHDTPRVLTACGGQVDRVWDALRFQFAVRGTPQITYGTEVGLTGAKEPENRGDMRFPMTATGDLVRALAKERRDHVALREGETRHLALDDRFYAFARVTDGEAMLFAMNRGDAPRVVAGVEVPPKQVVVTPVKSVPPVGTAKVRIKVKKAPTERHAQLLLVGAGEMFGHWDPAKGIALPATLELPREVYAYKLVVRHADGRIEWEEGDNRYLLPEKGVVKLTWRGKGP
ncbi:MAG: alpha-amylase family glycosyl hydrolase [Myxococcota bacterium]